MAAKKRTPSRNRWSQALINRLGTIHGNCSNFKQFHVRVRRLKESQNATYAQAHQIQNRLIRNNLTTQRLYADRAATL